jgi:hypothetical protein
VVTILLPLLQAARADRRIVGRTLRAGGEGAVSRA